MTKPKNRTLRISRPDEETLIITLDGKPYERANHDEDGWAGMERVERGARRAAKEAGWIIEENEGDDDE